jgi:hypothetical protein
MATEYRKAKCSEEVRIAEDLQQLYGIAGVLLVDAEGPDHLGEDCVDRARHV